MKKEDLINQVAAESGLTKAEADRAIKSTFSSITASLKQGQQVRIVGFGTFLTNDRPRMEGRNPRTGEKITIPATRSAKFRAAKQLKESIAK